MELIWHETKKKLPPAWTKVLGWDRIRNYTICQWMDRPDCKPGQYWEVNRSSGGIGTKLEVKPPEYWMELPDSPVF